MTRTDPVDTDVRQQAADAFARLRQDELPEAERQRIQARLHNDPDFRGEFDRIDRVWRELASLEGSPIVTRERRPEPVRFRHRLRMRPSLAAGGAVAAVLIVALVVALPEWLSSPSSQSSHLVVALEYGEQRDLTLDDGSLVALNSNAEIQVIYTDDQRRVDLLRGQVVFSVEKGARPFIVHAGGVTATVLGTQFEVLFDDVGVALAVIDGRVAVAETVQDAVVWSRTLEKGTAADLPVGAGNRVRVIDPGAIGTWRYGVMDFDRTSIADAVRQAQQYIEKDVIIADEAVAAMPISGVFNIRDIDYFFATVEETLPISAEVDENGAIVLRARSSSP